MATKPRGGGLKVLVAGPLRKALKKKLFEPVIYNYMTIPKYVYTFTSN